MNTVVLVPRCADGGRRDAIWDLLQRRYWPQLGYQVVEGQCRPFNRAKALNRAACVVDWDVALVADSDTYADPELVQRAVREAEAGRLVISHRLWCGVTEIATAGMLAADRLDMRPAHDRVRQGRRAVSGILAVSRELWEAVRGFDEGFRGYGMEDYAFARACALAAGEPWRLPGVALHLNHPRAATAPQRNALRYRLYRQARSLGDVLAIR